MCCLGGGFGQTLLQDQAPTSTTLESVGDPGPGKWVTIYANAGHAYIEVAGIYLDTAAGLGNPPNPPLMTAEGREWLRSQPLSEVAHEQVAVATAMVDERERQIAPLDKELKGTPDVRRGARR